MNRQVVIFLSSWLVFAQATGQENQFKRTGTGTQRYWGFGLGISSQSMYDESISYVRYRNAGLGASLKFARLKKNKYSELSFEPAFVKLKTKLSNELRPMAVSTIRVGINYQQLKMIKSLNEKTTLFAGGLASLLFNLKMAPQLDNSQLVYDYALSVGVAGKLDRRFYWNKRNCLLTYNLGIPVVSHIARPYYLNRIEFIDPKNNFIGDLFSNSKIVSFNRLIRVTSGVWVNYPLFNSNMLRLGYRWDFYKMRTNNKVYAAEHLISLAFLSNY